MTRLNHLLTLNELDKTTLKQLLARAQEMSDVNEAPLNLKIPESNHTMASIFFEPSTRTKASFDIAAQRLGLRVLHLDAATSSMKKGESLLDTIDALVAMGVELLVLRHPDVGAAHAVADHLPNPIHVINAGDGSNAHPTQGLIDLLTIQQKKQRFDNLCVTLIGDIAHSRVAHDLITGLKLMGTGSIRVAAPSALLPTNTDELGVDVFSELEPALQGADVVVALRLQVERMQKGLINTMSEFHSHYGLTVERLSQAKPDAIVLHPGPINRGVEITSEVADGPQSCILQQVKNGVAMRMAIIETLLATA